jgi:acetylornithine aminotransferase/acetylornithine/N-succinyldiaminopimelate aminotransferase
MNTRMTTTATAVTADAATDAGQLYDTFVLQTYARPAITLVRGSGVRAWDDAGRESLDFSSGVAVSSLGHCHPHWVAEVRRQAGELIHTSNVFRNPLQGELARRLAGSIGPGRVFFCNSGAEANEALLKLARLHGMAKAGGAEGRCHKIICAKNAFHGRTFGAMSATPQAKVQGGFAPLVPGFAFAEFNNAGSFEKLVDAETAAILVEPVQGESGVLPATPEFLRGLRALCDRHNLLLLLDEVQTGVGRTGKFLACEHAGARPDAVSLAKGLGGGLPIGAAWMREGVAGLFHAGQHGTTFGGTPLVCAAALAVLDVIEREHLLERVRRLSAPWIEALRRVAAASAGAGRGPIAAVRGMGYLVGVQMADGVDLAAVVARLREAGLLVAPAGNNTFRLLPPLIASEAELAESVELVRGVVMVNAI